LACVDRGVFEEMAWGLASSGEPFLWAIARQVWPGDQEQGEDCHLGSTEIGVGARSHWCILDTLWMELDIGERLRRRAHACAAVLCGPDGECEICHA
jgi:hypothetical protein